MSKLWGFMSSKLEHLDTDVKIPFDEEALKSGDPVRTSDYLLELVKTLQELLEKITVVSNYAIDLVDGEAVYYALKGSDGTYPNGTWRSIQVGDNLEQQVKIDGTWTIVQRRERPL